MESVADRELPADFQSIERLLGRPMHAWHFNDGP